MRMAGVEVVETSGIFKRLDGLTAPSPQIDRQRLFARSSNRAPPLEMERPPAANGRPFRGVGFAEITESSHLPHEAQQVERLAALFGLSLSVAATIAELAFGRPAP